MQYVILIYDEERETAPDPANFQKYLEVSKSLREAGKFIAAEPLMGTDTATCVRIRGEKTLVTDGPFAETREALGGFYLVDAKNLDDALEIAARLPAAKTGTVEIRPVRKHT